MKKNQSGITLIALVITIIVLLILAGVSIAMLTGDNGILNKATQSKEASSQAEAEEVVKIALATILANKNDPTYTNEVETNKDYSVISKDSLEGVIATEGYTATATASGKNFIVKVNGYNVTVDENGKIVSTTKATS